MAASKLAKDSPVFLTTVPEPKPDWVNNERELTHLEAFVIRKVGRLVHRDELARVAGDFNPHPTLRQRCEAVLLAIRRAESDAIIA